MENDDWYVAMAIPNTEVQSIYQNQISNWFWDEVKVQDLSVLYAAMLDGNTEMFRQELGRQLQKSFAEAIHYGIGFFRKQVCVKIERRGLLLF